MSAHVAMRNPASRIADFAPLNRRGIDHSAAFPPHDETGH